MKGARVKAQLYTANKKHALNIKISVLEVKRQSKISQADVNHKKATVAILVSDYVDLRARNTTLSKEAVHGLILEENSNSLQEYSSITEFQNTQ